MIDATKHKNITLISYDSSYAGISFISNKFNNVILLKREREDFDKMILNKIIHKEEPLKVNNILNNTTHLIIFGVMTLKILTEKLFDINILNNFKYCTLIISDSTFFRESKKWNSLIKKYNIEVLIMPDLLEFLDKDIPYRPYFQHIPINNITLENKTSSVSISHSPGLKYKEDLKGTSIIRKILKNYNLDIIYNETWENCIKRKSKSHFFIDQIQPKNHAFKYKGGLGKSSLEAMLTKCLTMTSAIELICEPYFSNPPIVYIDEKNLLETINYYINNNNKYIKKVSEQYMWVKKYTSKEFVYKNILNL